MEDTASVEDYLRQAPIDYYGTFVAGAGGGHPSKQLVLLRGGFGALAKLVRGGTEEQMARAEVGAFLIARDLGWADLVPVTVYRRVPTADGDVDASVQVLWPAFRMASELGLNASGCREEDVWRVAILDAILQNADRNDGNWGKVASEKLALIDHGHSLVALSERGLGQASSPFLELKRNQPVPSEHLERVESFVAGEGASLKAMLEQTDRQAAIDRAATIVEGAVLTTDAGG